jgi:hypothetical protein
MVLKLSMCLSASKRDDCVVTEKEMSQAINVLWNAERYMSRVMNAITSEDVGDLGRQMSQMLKKNKQTNRQALVKRFMNKLTIRQIDEVSQALQEAGHIKIEIVGKQVIYTWLGEKK